MEILPVPEEKSLRDLNDDSSCSSLSSHWLEEGDDVAKLEALTSPSSVASTTKVTVGFWRKIVFGSLIGTAALLAVGSYIALTNWEDSNTLPGIFAAVIVGAFLNMGVVFYLYDRHVQKQLQHHSGSDLTPPNSDDDVFLADLGLNKKANTIYAMSSAGSISGASSGQQTGGDNNEGRRVRRVSSLLKKPFKSFRHSKASSISSGGADDNDNQQANMMMNGMASTESINQFLGAVRRETSFLSSNNDNNNNIGTTPHQSAPTAEFFAETTVLFADIAGFTAWASVREPSQVFTLLETLFHAFDSIAARHKVFKVETVGDCYVAVTGLPTATKKHPVHMAQFATDCLEKMGTLCPKLETQLGPDTGELNLRIGMHSGAVTGGVLRGKRSRFQLFGDTVNTAARIENTGKGGKIHLSETTAQLLIEAGKSDWMTKRENQVAAKGKGNLTTYWLNIPGKSHIAVEFPNRVIAGIKEGIDRLEDEIRVPLPSAAIVPIPAVSAAPGQGVIDSVAEVSKALGNQLNSAKLERLVSWIVDLLHRLLKQIVARRQILVRDNPKRSKDADESIYTTTRDGGTLLEEVKESIELPSFNHSNEAREHAKTIHLNPIIYQQLNDFVHGVANMYANHPFHNFEHASHVTMSVAKLLSRIVAPSVNEFIAHGEEGQTLHDHTYGITSDPLTQFTCVLSALIHDADHPGVPNSQLVEEDTAEAKKYKGKSVAESNSMDKCWELLMDPKYKELRETIYTTSEGLARFRSLLVNSVMATDICDKDLKNLRNARWDRAFNKDGTAVPESEKAIKDRKATIVIEHLIQASDVSHTMQHWHVYRRWNERLFRECYKAFKEGRAAKDPSEFWYQGEIGFFDFYIIPLAKKLKECGVFGVSSSEYLDYAISNRAEWEEKGKDAVQEMIAKVKTIEQEIAEKKAAEAAKAKGDETSDRSLSAPSLTGSSGMMSFDSRASLGFLGPLE